MNFPTYQERSFNSGVSSGRGGARERYGHSDGFVELPPPGLHSHDGRHSAPLLVELLGGGRPHLQHTHTDTDLLGQCLAREVTLEVGPDTARDVTSLRPHLEDLLARSGDHSEVLRQLPGDDPRGLTLALTGLQQGGDVLSLRGVAVEAPFPPVLRAQHHDLPTRGEGGEVRDLQQDRAEEGGGRDLDDPGGQTLPVTERREVQDLVRSELSDGESDGLLSTLGRDDNSDSSPPAACHGATPGIHQETDQEVCLDWCILSVCTRRPHAGA